MIWYWLGIIYLLIGLCLSYFVIELIENDEFNEKLEDALDFDTDWQNERQKVKNQMFFQGGYIVLMLYLIICFVWLPIIIYVKLKGDK